MGKYGDDKDLVDHNVKLEAMRVINLMVSLRSPFVGTEPKCKGLL